MNAQFRRRQAIVAGLAPLLNEEQIGAAVEIWDASFAALPSFNLQKYVDQVCNTLSPACARRDLHRALVKSVFLGCGAEAGTETTARGEATPEARVFAQLLSGFLDGVAGHKPAAETAIRGYLIDKLAALRLNGAAQDEVIQWLARRQTLVGNQLNREGMRNLLNLAYVLVCEYLGPATADRLLTLAVKQAEQLPEARLCAPRSLL